MTWNGHRGSRYGGSAPATPGFIAVAPEWLINYGAADAAPAIPAAESTLGSHPCVALSSAQVLPEWINCNLAGNRFAANGDSPLKFVSHSRGSLQRVAASLHLTLAHDHDVSLSGVVGGQLAEKAHPYWSHIVPQLGFQSLKARL